MAGQAGRPKKATTPKEPITAESVPEVPTGPAPGAVDVQAIEEKLRQEFEERLAKLTEAAEARIRELEERTQAVQAYAPVTKYEDKEGDAILIHFLEDGFTAQGASWYRGQELEVVVGSDAWNDTLDRNGDSWLSLTEADQLERYEKVYFRRGEWPGKKTYTAGEFIDAEKAPPVSELERADRLERERRRAAPRLPDVTEE